MANAAIFLTAGAHRVLYFWHSVGNRCLTLLSNMFTDLNLTDMETCYKVFRRDVLQSLELREKRFGFEPEVIAQVARRRLRIYEVGISYAGRTYEEGKKIEAKDGFRALYCIIRYNMPHAPLPLQFAGHVFVGGLSAIANLLLFGGFKNFSPTWFAAPAAFATAAILNYWLCTLLVFRSRTTWSRWTQLASYGVLVAGVAGVDLVRNVARQSGRPRQPSTSARNPALPAQIAALPRRPMCRRRRFSSWSRRAFAMTLRAPEKRGGRRTHRSHHCDRSRVRCESLPGILRDGAHARRLRRSAFQEELRLNRNT